MALTDGEKRFPFRLLKHSYHRREADGLKTYVAGDTVYLTKKEATGKFAGRVSPVSGEALEIVHAEERSRIKPLTPDDFESEPETTEPETEVAILDHGSDPERFEKLLAGLGWKDTVAAIRKLKTAEEVAGALAWEQSQLPQPRKSVVDAAMTYLEELSNK